MSHSVLALSRCDLDFHLYNCLPCGVYMTEQQSSSPHWHGTMRGCLIGYIASLILTLIAYFMVVGNWVAAFTTFMTIAALGCVQAIIQLIYFLHVGQEERPKWGLVVFLFMLMVLVIIVSGSLWIMHSLDSRMMPKMGM